MRDGVLEIEVVGDGSRDRTVRLLGELDTSTAVMFEEAVRSREWGGCRVGIDAGGLRYLSSAGLRPLVLLRRAVGPEGCVDVTGASGIVKEVLESTGFIDASEPMCERGGLTVYADPGLIPPALRFCEEMAIGLGVSDEDALRMRLGLEEILLSVFSYGYGHDARRSVDIMLSADDTSFQATVYDKGIPYDYEVLMSTEASDSASILSGMISGPVMENLGRNGRSQTLRFERSPPVRLCRAAGLDGGPETTEFDYHPMRPEEGIQVAQCLYDEFGYTYVNDIVYYPERFVDAVSSGALNSWTATAPSGEVAGHLTLIHSPRFPGTADMGMGVVKKRYRKGAVMTTLTERILRSAREQGLSSIHCECVAYHPYTQRICGPLGIFPCAACLNAVQSDMSTSYGTESERQSMLMAVLMMSDSHRTVHCPEGSKDIVDFVIRGCGLDRTVIGCEGPAEGSATVVSTDRNDIMRTASIFVHSAGPDVGTALLREHHAVRARGCEASTVLINLQDPSAGSAHDAARGLGYFVSGMFPGSSECDWLMMVNPISECVDYGSMRLVGEFERLVGIVRGHDPEGWL